jgi:hypothetical protein
MLLYADVISNRFLHCTSYVRPVIIGFPLKKFSVLNFPRYLSSRNCFHDSETFPYVYKESKYYGVYKLGDYGANKGDLPCKNTKLILIVNSSLYS